MRAPLFGTEWLESIHLDWPLLRLKTWDTILALEDVLSKHASVFSEGLGKWKISKHGAKLKRMPGPDSGK